MEENISAKHDKTETLRQVLLSVQSLYTLITGLWPIVDIHSFMVVTGPKEDIWLVKTVGALLIPVSLCLGSFIVIRSDYRPSLLLGSLTALAFATIDFYYSLNGTISSIYMMDGIVEVFFIVTWILILLQRLRRKS